MGVGVLFAALYARSRSLAAPILGHALGGDLPVAIIFYWSLQQVR
jgi:hypothetical protein